MSEYEWAVNEYGDVLGCHRCQASVPIALYENQEFVPPYGDTKGYWKSSWLCEVCASTLKPFGQNDDVGRLICGCVNLVRKDLHAFDGAGTRKLAEGEYVCAPEKETNSGGRVGA